MTVENNQRPDEALFEKMVGLDAARKYGDVEAVLAEVRPGTQVDQTQIHILTSGQQIFYDGEWVTFEENMCYKIKATDYDAKCIVLIDGDGNELPDFLPAWLSIEYTGVKE